MIDPDQHYLVVQDGPDPATIWAKASDLRALAQGGYIHQREDGHWQVTDHGLAYEARRRSLLGRVRRLIERLR